MTELQLRDRALEIARQTPGDLLENAERIYQWLVQTTAVKQGEVVFMPPATTEMAFSEAVLVPTQAVGGPPNVLSSVGERVVSSMVTDLSEGASLVRR